jgi:hypothetical protein
LETKFLSLFREGWDKCTQDVQDWAMSARRRKNIRHTQKRLEWKWGEKPSMCLLAIVTFIKRQRAKKCRVPPPKCLQRFCPSDCVDCCHTVNTTKLIKEKLKGLRLLGYHQISNWPHSHDDELIQFSHFYF